MILLEIRHFQGSASTSVDFHTCPLKHLAIRVLVTHEQTYIKGIVVIVQASMNSVGKMSIRFLSLLMSSFYKFSVSRLTH